jgi:hypothetical protein
LADFPPFAFTTQESWYGELSFKAAEDGSALSLAGRRFEMHITPATSSAQLVPPALVLSMDEGRGLAFKQTLFLGEDPSTLVFRVPKETANTFPRGEFTADVLEVVGGDRYLFMPVRITYAEPSGLRAFLSRFLGVSVSFAARQQPIYTPLAVPGREGRPGATIITGTLPPVPADGKDGDFFIEDRTGAARGRRMWGPKAGGAWPGTPWVIQVAAYQDVPGLPDELNAKAERGHTPVPDANYQCLQRDVQVGMTTLTAPRTISLPDVDTFPLGQDLVIADESGACSDTLTITIQPGPGTGDIIGSPEGATTFVLSSPYQAVRLRRGAANLWIRL